MYFTAEHAFLCHSFSLFSPSVSTHHREMVSEGEMNIIFMFVLPRIVLFEFYGDLPFDDFLWSTDPDS